MVLMGQVDLPLVKSSGTHQFGNCLVGMSQNGFLGKSLIFNSLLVSGIFLRFIYVRFFQKKKIKKEKLF